MTFKPPAAVYQITSHGMRRDARSVSTPVSAFTVAAPPNSGMEVTITLATKQKKMDVMCADLPHRARTISPTVCAVLTRRLTSMTRIPESNT